MYKLFKVFFIILIVKNFQIVNAHENERLTSGKPIGTLPVEITLFTYWMDGNDVVLYWTTATRINCYGFFIERKDALTDWAEIGFYMAIGDSYVPESFTLKDESPPPGIYYYRLKQIDLDESIHYYNVILEVMIDPPVNVDDNRLQTPEIFSLSQNYPNPFNPTTNFEFNITKYELISIRIYDVLGHECATLVNESKPAGTYKIQWDAAGFSSGIYFVRLISNNFSTTKKIVLKK